MASHETINFEHQSNYRLNEIIKIKGYFNKEIEYQQSLINKLNKYLSKIVFLTVLTSTNILSHIKKKKKLLGLVTSVFSLIFYLSFGMIIKLKQETKLRKKKHNKQLHLCKNKLDCIEMLISNSIKDGIISHDKFLEVLNEKKDYDSLKNEDKTEIV